MHRKRRQGEAGTELEFSIQSQTHMSVSFGSLFSLPSSQNRTVQEVVPRARRVPNISGALKAKPTWESFGRESGVWG